MYYDYFGLTQPPFKITPDTSLFFPGGNRGAILEALIYAITNGEGMVKVVGEVGTGKTMLCRMLEQELDDRIDVVYLANPSITPDQIPYAIAFELKLSVAASDNRLQVMNDLQDYLVKKHAENGQVVVFVEEAQSMSLETLEELRLLSNLETTQHKLLQIVLFGQPELDELIATPEIRQLKERITYSFQLSPFKNPEIKEYLNARLRACGYRAGEVFSAGAVKQISHYSNGLLRRINILADKSLLAAYANNMNQVTAQHVKIAARDSEFVGNLKRFHWAILTGAAVIALCLALLLLPLENISNKVQGMLPDYSVMEDSRSVRELADNSIDENIKALVKSTGGNNKQGLIELENNKTVKKKQSNPEAERNTDLVMSVTIDKSSFAKKKTEFIRDIVSDEDKSFVELSEGSAEKKHGQIEAAEQQNEFTGQLIALESLIRQQDFGNRHYSELEVRSLLQQLERLPSEVLIENTGMTETSCENCASIIYRPLYDEKNL